LKKFLFLLVILFLGLFCIGCFTKSGEKNVSLGFDAYDEGNYKIAIKELEKALDIGNTGYNEEEIYTVLGNAYYGLYEDDKAIEAHEKALEINPEYYEAWVNLGIVYRYIGNYEKAEECYNKAYDINPNYPELHISMGALYIYQNKPYEAVTILEKAVKLDPSISVAHSNLALAYAMVGRFADAENALRQATVLGYDNSAAIQERIDNLKELY